MHYRRLFLSLLLCVAIFFGAFSVSVSALDINGNTIKTYWNADGTDVEFSNTITSSYTTNSLVVIVDVIPAEIITEGSVYDFSLSFENSPAESMTAVLEFIDADGQSLGYSDTILVEGETLLFENLIADADLSKLRVLFGISMPEWDENIVEETPSSDTIEAGTYVAEGGQLKSIAIGSSYVWTYKLAFVSNGNRYNRMRSDVNYDGTGMSLFYNDLELMAMPFRFDNIAYATVIIAESQGMPAEFCEWFYYNYSKQGSGSGGGTTVQYTYDFSVTDVSYTNYGDSLLDRIWASIRQLPQYIANKIQGLFVPSEDDIIQIKGKFEALLEDRFGVVYEAHDIIEDLAALFSYDGDQVNITFPEVTVNLAGTDFSFGGWEVDLIPDGMEVLQDALKLIGNMVATLLFIMAMRKRYEEVVH